MFKLVVIAVLLLSACSSESKEYKQFVKEHGENSYYYCDGLFLMHKKFLSPQAQAPQEYLVNSNKCK